MANTPEGNVEHRKRVLFEKGRELAHYFGEESGGMHVYNMGLLRIEYTHTKEEYWLEEREVCMYYAQDLVFEGKTSLTMNSGRLQTRFNSESYLEGPWESAVHKHYVDAQLFKVHTLVPF